MTGQCRVIKEVAFIFKWGLVTALIAGFFFVIWLYKRLDDQLRREIESRLAQACPTLKIQLRSAQLLPGEGIQLRGLRVLDPKAPRSQNMLAEVEEIALLGPVDYKRLLAGQVPIQRVVIRRAFLRLACDEHGSWNWSRLQPVHQQESARYPIEVENSTVEIVDLRGPSAASLVFRDVQLRLECPSTPGDMSKAEKNAASSQENLAFRGTMTGDFVRRIDVEGVIHPRASRVRVSGSVDALEFSREFLGALPREVYSKLGPVENLRAQLSLSFRLFFDASRSPSFDFDVSGQIRRGRLDDPRLPYIVTDIKGAFTASRDGIAVTELSGSSGATLFLVRSARLNHWDLQNVSDLDVTIRNLRFDPALLPLLPRVLQDEWPKYFPEGTIHLAIRLSKDASGTRFHIVGDVEGVSFAYHRFPYRLQQTQGRLELTPDRLVINLISYAGTRPVEIRGQITHPLTAPVSQISVSGRGLNLDERLYTAVLDTKTRQTLRALHLSGQADFWLGLWQDEPGGELHRHLEATLRQCTVRYDEFPYPISNISGQVVMRDGTWSFRQLRGVAGPGQITAEGSLVPQSNATTLTLHFEGQNIRLDSELRDALRQDHLLQAWNELDPSGFVNLTGSLTYVSGNPLEVRFQAMPVGRGLSLQPRSFPYRVENIQGLIAYEAGTVFFKNLRGQHSNTEFQADGVCSLNPQCGWRLDLEQLWIDRLEVDRLLLAALPEELGRPLSRLNLQGPVMIRGRFSLESVTGHHKLPPEGFGRDGDQPHGSNERTRNETQGLKADWDVTLTLVQNTLGAPALFENVSGQILLRGQCAGGRVAARGYFNLDALEILGLPIAQLRGPFHLTNELVIFGPEPRPLEFAENRQAAPRDVSASEQLTASFFQGAISGGGWVKLSQPLEYDLAFSLVKADFNQLLGEFHNGPAAVRGILDAAVRLKGKGEETQGLSGYGNFQLREADIYELPLMIALLKILSIRRPDTTAFSESSGQFRVAGRHIYFDTITFSGDALSLTGQGEVDLDGNLRLVMRAMLGRREIQMPVVREVFRGASEQIVLVHVGGNLREPIVRREPFPGVNEALQRFQLGTGQRSGRNDIFKWR